MDKRIVVVDFTANPFLFNKDWKAEDHNTDLGKFELDMSKIEIFKLDISKIKFSKPKFKPKFYRESLREELGNKIALNVNFLFFLRDNPDFIPYGWEKEKVGFCGTLFQEAYSGFVILGLNLDNNKCGWTSIWLGPKLESNQSEYFPVAVLSTN